MSRRPMRCLSRIWLSKADFTWLIVISHRYSLGFTLYSRLTNSILDDVAVARHLLVVISWLIHDSRFGHVVYVFPTWLIVMSHGFHACDALSAHDLVYEFWLVFGTSRSWLIQVNWWISHYNSLWVMSRVTWSMSHTGLGFVGYLGI